MKDDALVVLLVEDNPHHAELIFRLLRNRRIPHRLQRVSDGEAALDYLNRRGAYADALLYPMPHLVLLDLRLPKVDGLGVLQRIREEELEVGTIWTMTGAADDDSVRRSLELGASDVFTKPLNLPHLDWLLQVEHGRVAASEGD